MQDGTRRTRAAAARVHASEVSLRVRLPARRKMRSTMLAAARGLAAMVLLLTFVHAHAALGVDDIDRLVQAGAAELALRIIDREQPPLATSAARWQRFERRRLEILAAREDWASVVARVDEYPRSVPDDFWSDAREMLARAHLAAGDARAAIDVIAELIWGPAQDTAMVLERNARLERWRALLAESYLLAGRLDDARTSALRYRLDYSDDPPGWRLMLAKALVRNGELQGARDTLDGFETTQAAYLRLLARAREAGVDPVDLLTEMSPMLGGSRLLPAERAQLWAALAAAAAAYRDHTIRVTAMEQAVALDAPIAAADRFVRVDADDLWNAYEAYAGALANEARLLVGRFDAWLELARQYDGTGDVRARALYAYLAGQKRDPEVAGAARTHLVEALAGESRGLAILGALYVESGRYPRVADIPPELRAPLVAYALETSRSGLTAELLVSLDAEARDSLALRWRTAVAVALVENDRVDEALALFAADNDARAADADSMKKRVANDWANDLADSLAKLALALQVAGEYGHSATLALRALSHARDPLRRRALLVLSAESEALAGDHERAAQLYLDAAGVAVEAAVDGQARAARLEAARALVRAGLAADAVGVLERLPADGADAEPGVFLGQILRSY